MSPETPFFQVELDRIHIAARAVVSRDTLRAAKRGQIFAVAESTGRTLGVMLDTYILGLRDKRIELHVRYPADWWQAFRERWFPGWWLKRHPVRYVEHHVDEQVYKAVCPHLDAPDGEHVRFALSCGSSRDLESYRKVYVLVDALRRIAACEKNPDPHGYLPALAQDALVRGGYA